MNTASKRAAELIVKENLFIFIYTCRECKFYPAKIRRVKYLFIFKHGRALTVLLSELGGLACKVLLDHKSNLEGYGVVELTKIETGKLSDLFESVNESVSVNEELS